MKRDDSWLAVFDPGAQVSFFQQHQTPDFSAKLDQDKLKLAWFLSECARLSYVSNPQLRTEMLQHIGGKDHHWFEPKDLAAGIWSWDDTCIVVFRGTKRNRNWLRNLRVATTPYQINNVSCKVHAGFLRAFEEIWADIHRHLPAYKQLICTGHSLGGAIASIAGIEMNANLVCTFGSPRIGNHQFCTAYPVAHQRYCTVDDVITHLPISRGPSQYQHIGPAIWLGQKGRKRDRFKQRLKQPKLFLRSPKHISDHAPINYSRLLSDLISN